MNPELVKEIIALIALAGTYGPELYLKLKAIGELGSDEQANIHKQITDGIVFDLSMKQKYAQWRIDVGLDPAPPAPPAAASAAVSTVHDSSSTIPPAVEPPKAGSD